MNRIQWRPLILFSVSVTLTLLIYYLTSNSSPNFYQPISFTSSILPVEASDSVQQGKEIILNGKKYQIPWSQWQEGDNIRTGISDIGAMNLLGLQLLSTQEPNLQPVRWFGTDSGQPLPILARFIAPYRYLDVTELIQLAGGQLQVNGNTLDLNFPVAQISNIRQGNQPWGKRIVLDVDRPTVWQVSQAKGQGVITISGQVSQPSISDNNASFFPSNPLNNPDEDDLGSGTSQPNNSALFSLENTEKLTKINVNLPTSSGLNVFSLSNPNRIIIDVRSDVIVPKEIVWNQGIIWRQQFVKISKDIFPVNWLEIDQRSPKISLKPIISNPNRQQGTAPLVTTAQNWQASAAINGGFFNRNNQLPLGAIRQNNNWLSSPILGRGAVAWNDRGQVNMNRLNFRENLIISTGKTFPILFLNSGYVQGGIARYTPEWGDNYINLSDNETIISVNNNQIIAQKQAEKVGNNTFPIPSNGYLLIIRKNAVAPSLLSVGMNVKIETNTMPPEFNQFSHIVGAGPLLISNRRIVLNAEGENFSKWFQQQKASRSAIGVTNKGTIMLVAVHTRVGGSGATLDEMAQIMQQLGAVNALNLDGGSSTSLALGGQLIDRSAVTAAKVHNGIGVFVNP